MLVLSRKPGESVKIGDDVTVYVSRISGNRVTLSFEAPRSTRIVRGELELFDEAQHDDSQVPSAAVPSAANCIDLDLEAVVPVPLGSNVMAYAPRRAR
ncbi:MAG: carbon storage regulator [Planctomycetales bacterium]